MFWGVIFAFGALFSWGFGDFFIQRSTRAVGDLRALFYIGFFGAVVLLPFAWNHFPLLFTPKFLILLSTLGIVTFFTALSDFEGLKEGKLAIIEPVLAMELPLTAALSFIFWGEHLNRVQLILILITFIGIMVAITREKWHLKYHQRIFEKGVMYAGLGMIGMSLVNFMTGISAQTTTPILTMWVVNVYLAVLCFIYMLFRGDLSKIVIDFRQSPRTILAECILDNAAWIFFAYSMTHIPISIATAISETYVMLTVFLGLKVNHEKIKSHQKIGAIITIISILALAFYA